MTDFDKLTQRFGTNSYKWDLATNTSVIPLWVADMDFETAPCIIEALNRRVAHGIFGYTHVPQSYYDSVCRWFDTRHGWHFSPCDIIYTSGVVPAISAIIKALTLPGDQVIVQGPVYNCFYSSIRNNGCETVSNPLTYNRTDQRYEIDFDDLEEKLSHDRARIMLLCNPHNPGGRVWTRQELLKVAQLCLKHGVRLVADEIHCELTFDGISYTPVGSLSDEVAGNAIVCCSPTKAFNIAGLQIANIICKDPKVLKRIDRAININEVCDVNPFGVEALQAAYSDQGDAWLTQLRHYLTGNYTMLLNHFATKLHDFPVMQMEGTYLAWVDCDALGMDSDSIESYLLDHHKVWVNAGTMYGHEGRNFIRINMACPRLRLQEGLDRITEGLTELKAPKKA